MKKLFVHLSVLCLLAALAVPMVGCGGNETEVEDTATTGMEEPSTATTDTGMGTDMGGTTDMGTMGTDMGTTDTMGTEMTPPPAQ